MGAVVVFCETTDKGIRSASLPALTAGARLAEQHKGPLVAVVIGAGIGAAAHDAARYAAKVLAYDDAKLAAPLAETYAPLLADAVKRAGATALLGTATSSGKDILPRAAALLGAGMASDIMAVAGANRFRRPAYAGNALEEVELGGAIVVASVRQTEFPPAAPARRGPGTVEKVAVGDVDALGAEVVGAARHQERAPRPGRGQGRGLGRPRHEGRRELQDPRGADRPAGRRAGRQPRRLRRRHGAERSAGRPDRQGRRAPALHRGRDLGRHPAPGRHEGLEGHRRHQQGRRGAHLPGRRLRPGRHLGDGRSRR